MTNNNLFMDDELITVSIPAPIAHKMVKPWYLMRQWESEVVRQAFREATKTDNE